MYPKYLELFLENLQFISHSHLEILLDDDENRNYLNKIYMVCYNLMKKKFDEEHFTTDTEKNINEGLLNAASIIIHNICCFCCDEYNFRFSEKISKNIKNFMESSKEIFYESMKYLFEAGLNFPDAYKKHTIIVNALFPLIVLNRNVYILFF